MPVRRRRTTRPNVTTRAAAIIARKAFPFFKLPAEIRNIIYEYALGWSYAMDCIAQNQFPERWTRPFGWEVRWTPGILLANRQFYAEAVGIAYEKPLRIEHPRSNNVFLWCFSASTLRRLRFVNFEIDVDRDARLAWSRKGFDSGWCRITRYLASVWHSEHDLQLLKITISDRKETPWLRGRHWRMWNSDGLDGYLRDICSPLRAVGRVKEVVIEGDIPTWYANELKAHMEAALGLEHIRMFIITNRERLALEQQRTRY